MSRISSARRKNAFTTGISTRKEEASENLLQLLHESSFIGVTEVISTACTQLAAQRGIDLTLATRGPSRGDLPPGVRTLIWTWMMPPARRKLCRGASFDVVVDWIAFTPRRSNAT
jgi:hypothetical protein